MSAFPASHPEVNALLGELLAGAREVLGPELVGMYVSGSRATGEFDRASDVDVVVVTETEVRDERLASPAEEEAVARTLDFIREGVGRDRCA